jgi:hypothetical protein
MGVGREKRESEKQFDKVWDCMRSLTVCVWYGGELLENAKEDVERMKILLGETIKLMELGR